MVQHQNTLYIVIGGGMHNTAITHIRESQKLINSVDISLDSIRWCMLNKIKEIKKKKQKSMT